MKKLLLILIILFPTLVIGQLQLPYGIKVLNPRPLDAIYFESDNTPYDNTAEVLTAIPSAIRYRGLTVNVAGVEYWFGAGTADVDLVVKLPSGMVDLTSTQTITGRKIFTVGTLPGINIGAGPAPSTTTAGDLWFNNTTGTYQGLVGGQPLSFITTGNVSGANLLPYFSGANSVMNTKVGFEFNPTTDVLTVGGLNTLTTATGWNSSGTTTLTGTVDVSGFQALNFGTGLNAINSLGIFAENGMSVSAGTINIGSTGSLDLAASTTATLRHDSSIPLIALGSTGAQINLGSDAIGDIYQRNASGNFSRLASVATGNALISGGIGAVNSWGKITSGHIDGTVAPITSPAFLGTPSLPTGTIAITQSAGNSTTAVATTAFVTTADNLKANLASPTFTGVPAAPTAASGTNTTQIATTAFVNTSSPKEYGAACSAIDTLIVGTNKGYFRVPRSMTVTAVRASLLVAQTTGTILTVDINENGTTILSTKLTIDNNEKTSTTAATPAVISDTSLADDAEITFDIDAGDASGEGVVVWIIGHLN